MLVAEGLGKYMLKQPKPEVKNYSIFLERKTNLNVVMKTNISYKEQIFVHMLP